jgi:NAD(P)-dependent dehydrogenase (short-subunit alcohol dehydrogenase family)
MSINYYGCLNLSNALFPLLKSNSKVINIASMLGLLSRLPNEDLKKRVTSVQNIEQLNQIVEDYIKY